MNILTRLFCLTILAIVIAYDIPVYLIGVKRGVGGKYTVSTFLYNISKRPVLGPIILFFCGALAYHLFICRPGCG